MNHLLLRLALLNSLVLVAWAQYTTQAPPPSANGSETLSTETGSSCKGGNIHKVSVGSDGFKFDPNVIFAHPGDTVLFTFFPTNHSVVRSVYTGAEGNGNPCVPIEALRPGSSGFFSGNKPVRDFPNGTNVRNLQCVVRCILFSRDFSVARALMYANRT
jgi:plastocyanin